MVSSLKFLKEAPASRNLGHFISWAAKRQRRTADRRQAKPTLEANRAMKRVPQSFRPDLGVPPFSLSVRHRTVPSLTRYKSVPFL
jgi:hypothetical protein